MAVNQAKIRTKGLVGQMFLVLMFALLSEFAVFELVRRNNIFQESPTLSLQILVSKCETNFLMKYHTLLKGHKQEDRFSPTVN